MSGLDTSTTNFNIPLPRFDRRTWHEQYYAAMNMIDALLQKYIALRNVIGVWNNSTAYAIGNVLVDEIDGNLYECLVAHTSAATPTTFAQARAANPLLWKNATLAERTRGAWTTNTAYATGDFVVNNNIHAICNTAHTSGATFEGDADNWDYLIDFIANDVVADFTATGTPITVDMEDCTHARITVSSGSNTNVNLTPRSIGSNRTQSVRVTVLQENSGVLLFTDSIRWSGGVAPTYDQTTGTRAEYVFTTSDSGVTWDGFLVGIRMEVP